MTSPPPPSVLSVGTFDGVHIGHQSLIRRAREIAGVNAGTRVIALVFDPSPLETLRPDRAPGRLSMFEERRRWILDSGADEVVRLKPTPEFLAQTPEQFVHECVRSYCPLAFVEGEDFQFGRGRAGNNAMLAEIGRSTKLNEFRVEVVPTVSIALADHQLVPARSTIVRWLLGGGRVRDAAIVLGRPHEINGVVVRGDQRGRTIGFPTANLETSVLVPADGVYAATATLPDGRRLGAAVSIGTKPTFGPHARAVEAFLLRPGTAGKSWQIINDLPEYGWPLRLHMLAWVREQVRFASLPSLLDQMDRDCQRCHEIASDHLSISSSERRPRPQEVFA